MDVSLTQVKVSKYGLNQWARVSSLLARKTPKQCKARWSEWLDPGIRKIEWSKEEDEKLLHLAKLMPTQWRTIAPIVGRTATQCLERYQKLLDDAEAKENDELGLGGPDGGETAAPSADDVRRLRPGELDPDPESKPARPDTIDLDEDEKEMLSEARARLANTQGKKAKRKARERQLEESRRLASLQKRREMKNAGINIKIVNRKKGQMDYNADIPFEKPAAPGFYDTQEEIERNERQREAFDPRKQQLANKRKGDQEEDPERKRRKGEKNGPSAAFAAAAKAGQMQKVREAEQNSKRRSLVLPAPQVGESELEDIVKLGMSGERAGKLAQQSENEATRGLVGDYSNIIGNTPIRTPRAPPQEDRVANEIRNIKALTETQSSLLGGENTPLHEGSGSTGFEGATPRRNVVATPNPMATPFRQGTNGVQSTPLRGGRDSIFIGQAGGMISSDGRRVKSALKDQLQSLPKPKETDWELELPDEQNEPAVKTDTLAEDSADRDRRAAAKRAEAERLAFKRQTQVVQRDLPRPSTVNTERLITKASSVTDPYQRMVAQEMALLIANDFSKVTGPSMKARGPPVSLEKLSDDLLDLARAEILREMPSNPPLIDYADDSEEPNVETLLPTVQESIVEIAEKSNAVEKKLALHLGGYQQRAKLLRKKIGEAAEALETLKIGLETSYTAQIAEEAAISSRLNSLRDELSFVTKREREAQEVYRARKEELGALEVTVNGFH